jgi:8-oxo-dGTP diphosphatase
MNIRSTETDSPFANRIRLRSCGVIVQDSSILLTKIDAPTRPHPIWMPPGGAVQQGESLKKALIREMKEETQLDVLPGQLLWLHEFIEDPFHAVEFYFRCSVSGGEARAGSDPELNSDNQIILDLDFVPLNKIDELHVEPGFIKDFCADGANFFDKVRYISTS